jgi:beta-lactamase superfamily II metal-dependent hydrolase
MNELELIVFRVGHGLSVALIEKPSNYLTLIDLGTDVGFTPLKYLNLQRRIYPDVLYVTHPHADHLGDIETALEPRFRPKAIYAQRDYDWDDVASREKPECRRLVRHYQTLLQTVPSGSYGGSASLNCWRYTPAIARREFGDQWYVNASSLFLVYKWLDFKIAIAGDHESDVMERFVSTKAFAAVAAGTDILIAPHHGHSNGFCQKWATVMGEPYITLISVQERDQHVDGRYRNGSFAKGVNLDGKVRQTLTTRQDGNVFVRMYYQDGKPVWAFTTQYSL